MTETQIVFTEIFTVIPDSKSKIKSSSYLESGKYAVVDQGKELIAGYTDTSPTVVEKLLPVIVFGDHTRAVKYVDFPFTAGADGTQILKPSSLTNPKYGFYLVLHAVGNIPSKGYARHFGELKKMKFHLPSLEKQLEIVEKLDSAFAEIDLLERNLGLGDEKTNQLLQSLLSSAFSTSADENDLSSNSLDKTNATKLVPLGDVCTVINGGTPDTKNSKFWDGKHAWITPAEMGKLKSPYLAGSKRTLTYEGLSNSSAQLVPKYSVIMSSRAPIGHLVINEIPMASNQGCKGMIPNKNLNHKYLYYFLYANKQYLNELGSGTTFAEISGSKLKTVLIPLHSLEKQSDVVNKLDNAFTEIELLKAQIRTEKECALALRQSLLCSAFTQDEAVA